MAGRLRPSRGFTLVELLVAVAVMALLALVSWRGLDSMVQSQAANRARGDALVTLQTALAQWSTDLDAVVQLAQTTAIDWDGRVLRLTRRSMDGEPPAAYVVAWALRSGEAGPRWMRWQSPPLTTRAGWQQAWAQAGRWAQEGAAAEARRAEVALLPLQGWQLAYYRNGLWSPAVGADALGGLAPVPDGVRLVLELPPGPALAGTVVRDWVRPTVGGRRSS